MARPLKLYAVLLVALVLSACHAQEPGVRVLRSLPHQTDAFTQGLVHHEGRIFESTGLYGSSMLRETDLESGEVLRQLDLHERYFGEGLALVDDRLIMLTWKENEALVFGRKTFELQETFSYDGEGWGLCYDGNRLVMSDGSPTLQYRDPVTFELQDEVQVTWRGDPLRNLNELECVADRVYANVWLTDYVVRIEPDGAISAIYDLSGLLSAELQADLADGAVLNGIAWLEESQTFLVTGKLWPLMFEIKLD